MQRRNQLRKPRHIASRYGRSRRAGMKANRYPPQHDANRPAAAQADAAVEFGRFSVLLRQRQLLADGVPVELGTRAFDLLVVLLEADGALVTKEELISQVWPSVVVTAESNFMPIIKKI